MSRMDKLREILEVKKEEVAELLPKRQEMRARALERNEFRSFARALQAGRHGELAVIAEVKKASPSAGVIAADFDPVQIAMNYEQGGADAISVLTDKRFFQGCIEYLPRVRRAVSLPVLRKDFIIDEVQVYEASCAGADAILLIVAALSPSQLEHLLGVADACQLDALVEVHTLEEVETALDADAKIIGINNRNLATFEVSLETSVTLSEEVPEDILLVSESGIADGRQTRRLAECGFNAILVGETLMRSGDVSQTINDFKATRREMI